MEEQLQSLLDRIRHEGVEQAAAEAEADALRVRAERWAERAAARRVIERALARKER